MSSMNAFLSPSHFVLAGPERCLDASTLSFFKEERQRANTASPLEREEGKGESRRERERERREKRKKGREGRERRREEGKEGGGREGGRERKNNAVAVRVGIRHHSKSKQF